MAPGYRPVDTAWGVPITVDPSLAIGHSILTTGVFDLAVSEMVARLVPPGGTVIDAGANVGYMTVLSAIAAGPRGRVLAFEPHPRLFDVLRRNVSSVPAAVGAGVDLHNVALGDREGVAHLALPDPSEANDGTAHIVELAHASAPGAGRPPSDATGPTPTVEVPLRTLDSVLDALPDGRADVLKLDVEGFEAPALRGAGRALSEHRIRHVIFEDHAVQGSEVVRLLRSAGYGVLAFGWSLRRLRLEPLDGRALSTSYEAPSFVATLEAADVAARCAPAGWRVLRFHLGVPRE